MSFCMFFASSLVTWEHRKDSSEYPKEALVAFSKWISSCLVILEFVKLSRLTLFLGVAERCLLDEVMFQHFLRNKFMLK